MSDLVREMVPFMRQRLSRDEQQLGIFLRGNEDLHKALTGIIRSRIEGRAKVQEPSDPLMCKSMVARDRELQWLQSRLNFVYQSPVLEPAPDSEQPA